MLSTLQFLQPWEPSLAIQLLCTLAVGLYITGLVEGYRSGHREGFWKPFAFLLGVALMYFVTQTQYDYLSQYMFFIHRIQHLVLHHMGPFLIALSAPAAVLGRGVPDSMRRHAGFLRPLLLPVRIAYRILQQPVIATVLFVGLIFFWLTPSIHFDAMLSAQRYALMNWSMAVDGLLFWWLILNRAPDGLTPQLSYGRRILILAVIMPPQSILGAYIALSRQDLFDVYAVCGRAWPVSPIVDQQIGGLVTWIPASMMSVVAAVILLSFMFREHRSRRSTPMPACSPSNPISSTTPV
ncbi:cytochrome c oxidase assembly protein [Nitrococcus mobilis]|uniref:Predicted membrane protein n=1 Tax=Nitrococcus mobilis Nb-231 TaxID=314278 RepID=A4BSQ3_9GAMM|nr:cytochrome c oxidase assembly protein [Nitrococcus mobilis]EAR21323.1 predicted membrane protein [Nitrococcus mobilis Nb-231]